MVDGVHLSSRAFCDPRATTAPLTQPQLALAAYDGSGVALAVYAIRTSKRLRISLSRCGSDERLVGLHVNDCTMFTLDVAHIGGDFPA